MAGERVACPRAAVERRPDLRRPANGASPTSSPVYGEWTCSVASAVIPVTSRLRHSGELVEQQVVEVAVAQVAPAQRAVAQAVA